MAELIHRCASCVDKRGRVRHTSALRRSRRVLLAACAVVICGPRQTPAEVVVAIRYLNRDGRPQAPRNAARLVYSDKIIAVLHKLGVRSEPAFLTFTYNRYVPIPGSEMTAKGTYLERWDDALNKVRYAREGAPPFATARRRSGRTERRQP